MAAKDKDKHYWAQLRGALTAGSWGSSTPARAANGTPVPWSELLRKFKKHCGAHGGNDVAELASQTQALSLLLAAESNLQEAAFDAEGVSKQGVLDLGEECVLKEERREEAELGMKALTALDSTNYHSLKLALAFYAYALGRPQDCLSYISEVPSICDPQSLVPSSPLTSSSTAGPGAGQRSNAASLQVPGAGAPRRSDVSASSRSSVRSLDASQSSDINDGSAWAATESLRSFCLQAMSHEKLSPSDPAIALESYLAALPLITSLVASIPRPGPPQTTSASGLATTGSRKLDFTSFERYRELWRWLERLLWRTVILTARTTSSSSSSSSTSAPAQSAATKSLGPSKSPLQPGTGTDLPTLFALYASCSAHWPPAFRPHHRSMLSTLHLRFLVLSAPPLSPTSLNLTTVAPPWLATARSAMQEYRSVLDVSTRFPRAGQQNVKVEEFVDLSVAVWEAAGAVGEFASWIIDILWWATRLTFNSPRIYRHMTRLLHASGDHALAIRFLRLYIQIVSKAYETAAADATQARRDPTSPGLAVHVLEEAALEAETDRHWVETLVAGSRMLSRVASATSGKEGIKQAREAGEVAKKARLRLDKEDKKLCASVDLAEGIAEAVMASKEQDPKMREERLEWSLSLFVRSTETYPTPSAHHHLALALARPVPASSFNLDAAVESAQEAVEQEPNEVRHWHLLGLLLAARGEWKAAKGVLEVGAGVGETDAEAEAEADEKVEANGTETGTIGDAEAVVTRDYVNGGPDGLPSTSDADADADAAAEPPRDSRLSELVVEGRMDLPRASTLLQPMSDRPRPSRQEQFEQALQLRFTQLAVAELAEGPEGAEPRWLELFAWFSEKRALKAGAEVGTTSVPEYTSDGGGGGRPSMSDRRPSLDVTRSISPMPSTGVLEINPQVGITVSPATPNVVSPDATPDDTDDVRELGSGRAMDDSLVPEKSVNGSRHKVQRMLKSRVSKGQERINTISKKIGSGVGRSSTLSLRRSVSTPDFGEKMQPQFQASSIHSRRYFAPSVIQSSSDARASEETQVPTPRGPSPLPLPPLQQSNLKPNERASRDRRLLSDLWLQSAATFRRLGKIEQCRGAIQEAEAKDENNPAVWVQLGLYYVAQGQVRRAREALQKALFIAPGDVSAVVHLCRLYLLPPTNPDNVDLAAGMLNDCTRGAGWDVSEAWYFLGKAYGLQDRKDRERACLMFALGLAEARSVRDVGTAVGWCL